MRENGSESLPLSPPPTCDIKISSLYRVLSTARATAKIVITGPLARRRQSHNRRSTTDYLHLLAESLDVLHWKRVRRAKVDNQHLVFILFDDPIQRSLHLYPIDGSKVALKYRELQMLPEALHRLKDFAKPSRLADIIGNQVKPPHRVKKDG